MIEFLKNMVGQLKAKVAKVTKGIDRMIDFLDHPIRTLKTMKIKISIKSILIDIGKCALCILLWSVVSEQIDHTMNRFLDVSILTKTIVMVFILSIASKLFRFKWYTYLCSAIPMICFIILVYNLALSFLRSDSAAIYSIGSTLKYLMNEMGIAEPTGFPGKVMSIGEQAIVYVFFILVYQLIGHAVLSALIQGTKYLYRKINSSKLTDAKE